MLSAIICLPSSICMFVRKVLPNWQLVWTPRKLNMLAIRGESYQNLAAPWQRRWQRARMAQEEAADMIQMWCRLALTTSREALVFGGNNWVCRLQAFVGVKPHQPWPFTFGIVRNMGSSHLQRL